MFSSTATASCNGCCQADARIAAAELRRGNQNWEFDEHGLNRRRFACINDLPIAASDRKFHWDRRGPRPADHPGLSDLGL